MVLWKPHIRKTKKDTMSVQLNTCIQERGMNN